MKKELTIVVSALLIAAPAFALVTAADGPNENSEFGRCTAQENNEEGNNNSNGTVQDTLAFENLSEDDCDNATRPGNGSNDSNDSNDSGLSDLPDAANDNADDGEDNADEGSDNGDDGSDNADEGSDNGDEGSDNADDNADENAPDGKP